MYVHIYIHTYLCRYARALYTHTINKLLQGLCFIIKFIMYACVHTTYICVYNYILRIIVMYIGTYEGQRCIELPQSTEGFEVINCTSGVAGVGYHGDTCVIVYSNTMGQLYQLRSCQENTGWTIISGNYVNLTYIYTCT